MSVYISPCSCLANVLTMLYKGDVTIFSVCWHVTEQTATKSNVFYLE